MCIVNHRLEGPAAAARPVHRSIVRRPAVLHVRHPSLDDDGPVLAPRSDSEDSDCEYVPPAGRRVVRAPSAAAVRPVARHGALVQRPAGGTAPGERVAVPSNACGGAAPAAPLKSIRRATKPRLSTASSATMLAAMRAAPDPAGGLAGQVLADEPALLEPSLAEAAALAAGGTGLERAIAAGAAARRACKPPPRPKAGFKTSKDRSAKRVADAVDAVARLLAADAPGVILELIGGSVSEAQLLPEERQAVLRMALLTRAGSDGDMLVGVLKTHHFLRGFEAARRLALPGFSVFPMSTGLAALIIGGEHARCVAAGVGSRKGVTGGDNLRKELRNMRVVGYPLSLDGLAVESAAPRAKAGGGRASVAALMPLKVVLFHEWMCGARTDEIVAACFEVGKNRTWGNAFCMRFLARSLKLSETVSARLKDCERVEFFRDEREPRRVVRGRAYKTKDGEPLELFAYAEGFLGPFEWLEEHLRDIAEIGQSFPRWSGGYGSVGDPLRADRLLPEAAERSEIAAALGALWKAPPLSLSKEDLKRLALKGHCLHARDSDLMRAIGEHPVVAYPLAADLRRGFTRTERRAAGHWLRDKSEPDEQPLAQRGAGPAAPGGAAAARDDMEDYYSRGEGREGERAEQLRLRLRLARFVRAALVHWGGDWRTLECKRTEWSIVVPEIAADAAPLGVPAPPGAPAPAGGGDDDVWGGDCPEAVAADASDADSRAGSPPPSPPPSPPGSPAFDAEAHAALLGAPWSLDHAEDSAFDAEGHAALMAGWRLDRVDADDVWDRLERSRDAPGACARALARMTALQDAAAATARADKLYDEDRAHEREVRAMREDASLAAIRECGVGSEPLACPGPEGADPLDYSPREHDEEADAALEAILRAERDEDDAAAYHALMQADW
jgi:hypothetical protein